NNCVRTFEKITVQRGGSVIIPCLYEQKYKDHVKYWCKGSMYTFCRTMVRSDSPQSKGVQSVWAESSFTAERGGSVTIPCHYDQKYKHHVKYWCKGYHWSTCTIMVRSDSRQSKGDVSINDDPDQLVFTVTMRNLQDKDSGTYWCAVEINGGSDDAVILPLIVRTEERETRKRGIDVSFTATLPTDHEEEVSYSTVVHKKLMEEKKINKSSTHRADELIYSSVIKKKQSSEDPDGGKNEDGNWCSYYIG
ncbi:hypothetical protein Z043_124276, partial [Scleropages formosus]